MVIIKCYLYFHAALRLSQTWKILASNSKLTENSRKNIPKSQQTPQLKTHSYDWSGFITLMQIHPEIWSRVHFHLWLPEACKVCSTNQRCRVQTHNHKQTLHHLPKQPSPPRHNELRSYPKAGVDHGTKRRRRPKTTTREAERMNRAIETLSWVSSVSGKDRSALLPGVTLLMWV